ncbi:hypothetical protein EW026_g2897 [Hermanssonia centrifuga]|uniref:Ubiquitin-like domain-containing protein n=1 Tax=Hermanssonia centrifuga TaxID=98765 RepID=A0A4S4KLU9_9APHY|nr:hypothetical protein EW026_g2897 [Hermanssonia centrifuga]
MKVPIPDPPKREHEELVPAGAININIKSAKPAKSYALSVQVTDTIASIKSQLASEPGAPPVDVQRLLLKGKALADGKLLKEYDVKDGDTVNLMVKAGFQWDPSAAPPTSTSPALEPTISTGSITLVPESAGSRSGRGHARIPSVVLSPSPSLTPMADEKLMDIPLILDTSNIPPSLGSSPPDTPYHTTISQPVFWERLHVFLRSVFLTIRLLS